MYFGNMEQHKIVVTGGSGLVGGFLKKLLPEASFLSSKNFDLTSEGEVIDMFRWYRPRVVIHLAARVGGIVDNIKYPANYFTENVLMNTLLVKYAHSYGVERFLGVLSTCIYPDEATIYPLKESDLHEGKPTATNFSYGYAKRAMAVQIDAYNQQFGTKYNYLIPCNLYGEGDKSDPEKSHFVTALVRKIREAVMNDSDHIVLFGDGTPLRQFLHAEDFAKVIHWMVNNNIVENCNVATEEVYTIEEIAKIALKACHAEHLRIKFDTTKPNGQYRKDVSFERLKAIMPDYSPIPLEEGVARIYKALCR
jgi:GDP-L-fucose synthase